MDTDDGVRVSCASTQDMSVAESEWCAGHTGGIHTCNVSLSGVMSLLLDTSLDWTLKFGLEAEPVASRSPFAGTSFVCGLPDPWDELSP